MRHTSSRSPALRRRRWLFRLTGWPRYLLAGMCALLAIVSFVARPRAAAAPAASIGVAVAVRSLAAGVLIGPADVRVRPFPADLVPAGALPMSAVVGRRLGAAVDTGEPLTRARMFDARLVSQLAHGQVAVTVRLADSAQARGIAPGSRVDLYPQGSMAGDPPSGAARGPTAENVLVLAIADSGPVTGSSPSAGADSYSGPALVVACTRQVATAVAFAASTTFLATLVPPS